MSNSVIIFYEKHIEVGPTQALINLMPFLSSHGLKTHCFEDPSDSNKEKFISAAKMAQAWHEQGLNVKSLYSPYAQNVLYGKVSHEQIKSLSGAELKNLIKDIKFIAKGYTNSLGAALDLVETMDQNNVDFCTMDLPEQKREALSRSSGNTFEKFLTRDKNMVENILSHIDKGDVSILVGADHFNIATELKAQGVNVKEYYVTSSAIEPFMPNVARGDYCLRNKNTISGQIKSFLGLDDSSSACDNHTLDGLVVDLYNNPFLNPTKLIADDLSGTIYADHHSDEI